MGPTTAMTALTSKDAVSFFVFDVDKTRTEW